MTTPTILVVDDDRAVRESLHRALKLHGYDVAVAADGMEALQAVERDDPDAIVLDVMMPGVGGLALTRRLRQDGVDTPIIMLTARDAVPDRVEGLETGADDYLVKPFSMKELVARVRAASRRGGRRPEPERGAPIEIEELRLDPANVQAYVDGESAELTPTEFRLLYALAAERGRVLTRDELLQKV